MAQWVTVSARFSNPLFIHADPFAPAVVAGHAGHGYLSIYAQCNDTMAPQRSSNYWYPWVEVVPLPCMSTSGALYHTWVQVVPPTIHVVFLDVDRIPNTPDRTYCKKKRQNIKELHSSGQNFLCPLTTHIIYAPCVYSIMHCGGQTAFNIYALYIEIIEYSLGFTYSFSEIYYTFR